MNKQLRDYQLPKTASEGRYPQCCTSRYCAASGIECNASCVDHARLVAWKKWRDEHAAICLDPIWNPSVYVATK